MRSMTTAALAAAREARRQEQLQRHRQRGLCAIERQGHARGAVSGASPGAHGIHIHQTGDCSAADASSAGAHWNPDNRGHGSGADASASHLGDLGNIVVGADGNGSLVFSNPEWTLGTGAATDVIGHAIVVHANEDDLVTQNGDAGPGNSGGRQACGEIRALR